MTETRTVTADVGQLRRAVNTALEGTLPRASTRGNEVTQAMRYAVLGRGHRWRPILLLRTGMMYGRTPDELMGAAVAAEFLHCTSIILDDLPCMDDAAIRRGKSSCHVACGEAMTILASLRLTMLAQDLLDAYPKHLRLAAEARDLVCEMICGQAADLQHSSEARSAGQAEELLITISAAKTGRLLRFAVNAGAAIGEAPKDQRRALDLFAYHLALAYQFLDDVSDFDGTAVKQGKPAHQDIAKRRLTAVTVYGPDGARQRAQGHFEQAGLQLGKVPGSEGLAATARLLCGGLIRTGIDTNSKEVACDECHRDNRHGDRRGRG